MSDALAELRDRAKDLRRVFEVCLSATPGLDGTRGTCLYAAVLLAQVINKFGPGSAIVQGGDGIADGGILGADGEWHGHYWVRVRIRGAGAFIVDITADQFGHDTVVVLPLHEARGRYVAGDQATVDEHAAMRILEIAGTEERM